MAPSLDISVQITVLMPICSIFPKKTSVLRPLVSFHPLTATKPSRMSAETAILSGQRRTRDLSSASSVTAAVPRMTRETPASRYFSAISALRMPPPISANTG